MEVKSEKIEGKSVHVSPLIAKAGLNYSFVALEARQSVLKGELYSRFGNSINLDYS